MQSFFVPPLPNCNIFIYHVSLNLTASHGEGPQQAHMDNVATVFSTGNNMPDTETVGLFSDKEMLSLQCKQERVALGKGAFLYHRHPGCAGHPSDLLEEECVCRMSSW